mgnify:CR=1 FL=1
MNSRIDLAWIPACPLSEMERQYLEQALDQLTYDYNKAYCALEISLETDESLRIINRQYLNHDYFTDIITFDLSLLETELQGALYISVDRIRDHADHYAVPYKHELQRVILHGALHLVGFDDATEEDKNQMRSQENHYLQFCST